ncbi:hypothetical protein [Flavobacterium sp. XS2P14]|uniref:hypothetical protein n=1 Tax=Flavobacterium sp. XS2P14 TaxID=3401735 RepID=UPI003AAB9CF5
MEPNKLEKHFREQLNSREIHPSEMAWSKLDAMLAAADSGNSEQAKQKPKTKFPWMYVAASFVGFLLLGTVYFNQNSSEIINQKNDVVIQNDAATKPTVVSDNDTNLQTESEKAVAVVSKTNQGRSIKNSVLKQKSDIVSSNINQNQVVAVSINNQQSEQKSINSQTSDVTVDELLAVAGNPSKKENQLNQKPVVHVNASNLLSQVDGELELSFREKVISKVNKNYQTVKVALANRNLE